MSNQRVRCMFCFMESVDNITVSKEHLLSKPVADAFGIERDSPVLRTNAEMTEIRWARLNGIKYACVCTKCNNGWMNQLEHEMVRVATWLHGDPAAPLGAELNLALRRWAMKTHMLLCYIDGNAARFGDDDFTGEYVVPPSTPARQMYEGDEDTVLNRTAVGLNRSGASSDFIWSFDFPSVKGSGPAGRARFAPVTILTVGDLQLWIVTPLLDAEVIAPVGVVGCSPGIRPQDLRVLGHPMNAQGVTVEFACRLGAHSTA